MLYNKSNKTYRKMEIRELISFFINEDTKTLDVVFRTSLDKEDEVRQDKIFLEDLEEFDYEFIQYVNDSSMLLDEEEDDYFDNERISLPEIDDQEIVSFLNEFYLVYPENIPNPENF